ncbi:MAG: TauD/TfdA family dioxygenase [Alphaproteobacteria bacterium]|nr:TauD/TfdA family dioxygenase [Alphaproteobacteria bacterium]
MTANTLEALSIEPSGKALGAEILGIDFAKPVSADICEAVMAAWADHLVLLFRGLSLDDDQLLETAGLFGGQQEAGSRGYFVKAGFKAGETNNVATRPGVSIITNLGDDGKLESRKAAFGNQPLKWHSDNSYVEVPPTGGLLHAHIVPVNGGGETSFSNQYLAYERLPADLKAAIDGKHIRHDDHRNTTGRLRPTMTAPTSRDDITGPSHPIVRVNPLTGRRALYLGRHYEWPSSFIVELDDDESEALLGELWDHATQDDLTWTHDNWTAGDLLLWDNRCTMHARTPIDFTQPRVMHRALIKGDPVIAA